MNAAIIDQLAEDYPNQTFIDSAMTAIKGRGFNATLFNTSITVDFFRELAKRNYGLIVLRAHTALRDRSPTIDIFTSEKYDSAHHRSELDAGLVTKGILNVSQPPKEYFAITSEFIEKLDGSFPQSIIMAMGCWSLKQGYETMAKAFIDKGARAYIGWTDLVLPQDTDVESMRLLRALMENKTVSDAVSQTRGHPYSVNGGMVVSRLTYYPSKAGSLKLSDLINELKAFIIIATTDRGYGQSRLGRIASSNVWRLLS